MRHTHIHPAGLVVGGYQCPTSGEIASRTIPSDNQYYLTEFGGGSDTQSLACGNANGIADGSWYYMADSWRWPCGSKVQIQNPANGLSVVCQVADVGPNICVEQAAGKPVIDASPLASHYLFGRSVGYSDHKLVVAAQVDSSTPLGPTDSPLNLPAGITAGLGIGSLLIIGGGAWMAWEVYKIYSESASSRKKSPTRRRR
jgi:hypothetical protein